MKARSATTTFSRFPPTRQSHRGGARDDERVRGHEALVLDGLSIRLLEPLEGVEGLRRIEIPGGPVTSLEPLQGEPLRDVDIRGTGVPELSPLAHSNRLTRLSVSSTVVDDLRPVARLPALAFLDASSTPTSHLVQLVTGVRPSSRRSRVCRASSTSRCPIGPRHVVPYLGGGSRLAALPVVPRASKAVSASPVPFEVVGVSVRRS